jgi:hypothetical protein
MKRGQIRGVEAGQVRGVDEDRYNSKGCCGPDTSWDKNVNIVLFFHEDACAAEAIFCCPTENNRHLEA